MDIEMRKIDLIRMYKSNPRDNDDAVEVVAASLKEFGFRQPIVVDEDGIIIVGETRWKAAKSLGMKTVPVHVAAGMTSDQATAYRLADNKTGEVAKWKPDILPIEIGKLKNSKITMSSFGFLDQRKIDEHMTTIKKGKISPMPQRIWALISIPLVRFGEIAEIMEELGKNKNVFCEIVGSDQEVSQ